MTRFPFEDHERYTPVSALNGGVLGPTFLVEDQERGELHIFKLIEGAQALDIEALRQDFAALQRLKHPNLVPYEELLYDEEHIAIVRPQIQGQPFLAYIQADASEQEHDAPRTPQQAAAVRPKDDALDALDSLSAQLDQLNDPLAPTDLSSKALEDQLQCIADESTSELGEIIKHITKRSIRPPHEALHQSLKRLRSTLPQLLSALELLHRYRRCHGELHPHNVLVDEGGRCHLIEYGLAPLLPEHDHPDSSDVPLDNYHSLLWRRYRSASPYFAPEVILEHRYSAAADIYSLGCLIFEALTGRAAFEPFNLEQDLWVQRSATPSLLEHQPHCPSAWAELLQQMLSLDPSARPTSDELLAQFTEYERDEDESTWWEPTLLPPSFIAEPMAISGRDELVDELLQALDTQAEERYLPLYLVEGHEGTGKHHLTERVCYELARRGWSIMQIKSGVNEAEPMLPWRLIATQLRELIKHCPDKLKGPLKAQLIIASSLLPDLLPQESAAGLTDTQELAKTQLNTSRLRAIKALGALLTTLAKERPLLILITDLHHFSPDALDLLHDLRASPLQTRCALLATTLPGAQNIEPPHQISAIKRFQARHFTPAEAKHFLEPLAPPEIFNAFEPFLAQDKPRSPLLLKELLFDYQQRLQEEPNAPVILQGEPLQTLYLRRIGMLKPREREVLELIALSAGALRADLLHQLEIPQLDEVMNKLLTWRLIKRTHTALSQTPGYRTSHAVIREVVLKTSPGERRQARFCALAKALEKAPDKSASIASYAFEYWRHGQKPRKAALYAPDALEHALQHQAYHAATAIKRWQIEQRAQYQDQAFNDQELYEAYEELLRYQLCARRPKEAANSCAQAQQAIKDADLKRQLRDRQLWCLLAAGPIHEAHKELESTLERRGFKPLPLAQGHSTFEQLRWRRAYRRWRQDLWQLTGQPLHDALHGDYPQQSWPLLSAQLLTPLSVSVHRFDALILNAPAGAAQLVPTLLTMMPVLLGLDYQRITRNGPRHLQRLETLSATTTGAIKAHTALALASWDKAQGHYPQLKARKAPLLDSLLDLDEPHQQWLRAQAYSLYGMAYVELGELTRARRYHELLIGQERGLGPAQTGAAMIESSIALLCGDLILSQQALDKLKSAPQTHPHTPLEIWAQHQQAKLHLAAGRPDVSVAQLEILQERMRQEGMALTPTLMGKTWLLLSQALLVSYMVEHTLHESQRYRSLLKLKKALHQLNAHKADLGPLDQVRRLRALARAQMFKAHIGVFKRRAMHTALEIMNEAVTRMVTIPNALEQALCAEARGLILQALEAPEGRALITQAHKLYEHLGISSPLHLEGWPLPKGLSALHED